MRRFHRREEPDYSESASDDSSSGDNLPIYNESAPSIIQPSRKQKRDRRGRFRHDYLDKKQLYDHKLSDAMLNMANNATKKSVAYKSQYEEDNNSESDGQASNKQEEENPVNEEEEIIEKNQSETEKSSQEEQTSNKSSEYEAETTDAKEDSESSSDENQSDSSSTEKSSEEKSSQSNSSTTTDKSSSSDESSSDESENEYSTETTTDKASDTPIDLEPAVSVDKLGPFRVNELADYSDKDVIKDLNPIRFLPFSIKQCKSFIPKEPSFPYNKIERIAPNIYQRKLDENTNTKHTPLSEDAKIHKKHSHKKNSTDDEEKIEPFIFPPLKYPVDPQVVSKGILTDKEECVVLDAIRNWRFGQNIIIVENELDRKLYISCSIIATLINLFPNIPSILVVTDEVSHRQWIQNLNFFGEFNILAMKNGTKIDKIDKKICDVLLVTQSLFMDNFEDVPDYFYGCLIVENFGKSVARMKNTILRDQIKRVESYSHMSFSETFDNYTSREIQIMLGTIRGRRSELYTKSALMESLNEATIYTDKISNDRNRVNNIHEELILCPISEYQADIFKKFSKQIRSKMRMANPTASDMVMLCSSLYSICSHPVFESDHVMDDDEYTCLLKHHSAKLIFLEKLLKSELIDKQRIMIICEDDDSCTLLNSAFTARRITYMIVDSETTDKECKEIVKLFVTKIPLVIVTEERTPWALNNLSPSIIIPFDVFWRPVGDSLEILKKNELSPRVLRLITKNSIDQDIHAITSQSDKLNGEILLSEDTTDLEMLDILLRKSMGYINNMTTESLDGWWRNVYNQRTTSIYGYPETFPKFDDSDVRSPDFWVATTGKEKLSKKQKADLARASITSPLTVGYVIEKLRNFGIGRWDVFTMLKENPELPKLCYNIIGRIEMTPDVKYFKFFQLHGLLFQPSHQLVTTQFIMSSLAPLTAKDFISDFETAMTVIHWMEHDFEGYSKDHTVPKPSSSWSENDEKQLFKDCYEKGLNSLKASNIAYLKQVVEYCYDDVIPYIPDKPWSQNRKKITAPEHKKIVDGLVRYGFPDIHLFLNYISLQSFSPDSVVDYIKLIINYCKSDDSEAKKKLSVLLADKIKNYVSQMIIQRIDWFVEMRKLSNDVEHVCAEDLELLQCGNFHGVGHYVTSPTFTSLFKGYPSEGKIAFKLKQVTAEVHSKLTRHAATSPSILSQIKTELPFRLSDQVMLESIGVLDTRPAFFTRDAVYMVGYKVLVITLNPIKPELLIPVQASIEVKNNAPLFVIKAQTPGHYFEISARSPEAVWELYKFKCQKHTKLPVHNFFGNEMYGFTTPNYHKIMFNILKSDDCLRYERRIFSDYVLKFDKHKIIPGQYSTPTVAETRPKTIGRPKFETYIPKQITEKEFKFTVRFDFSGLNIAENPLQISGASSSFGSMINLYEDTVMDDFYQTNSTD